LAFTLTPIPLATPVQTGPQSVTAGVYIPALTGFGTLTNDWSVAIYYGPAYGVIAGNVGSTVPAYVTVDANDSVYFSNLNASSSTVGNVVALTSDGRSLWTSATDAVKFVSPRMIAADASGHVWVANGSTTAGTGFVREIDATSGATISDYASTAVSLYGVAVDSLGDVWYSANTTVGQNLHELLRSGTTYAEVTNFAVTPASTTYQLLQLRPDINNDIWVAGYSSTGAAAVYFPNTGTAAAPAYGTGLKFAPLAGVSSTYGITTDASGSAYAVTNSTGSGIYKTTVAGTGAAAVLTPTNVAANPAAASRFMDIDGAGSIWYLDNLTGTSLYQYVPSSSVTTSFYPCYNAGTTTGTSTSQVCTTGMSTKFDLAVDSTGSVWVASYGNSGGGRIVQIVGLAAPTVPLKALGKPGVMP
jgi:hypothetical protein